MTIAEFLDILSIVFLVGVGVLTVLFFFVMGIYDMIARHRKHDTRRRY